MKIKKLLFLTPLLFNNAFASYYNYKTIYETQFIEATLSTGNIEKKATNIDNILLVKTNSEYMDTINFNSKFELEPINKYLKFGFDFTYETSNYDNQTLDGNSNGDYNMYELNIFSKWALFKRRNFNTFFKFGLGYTSYNYNGFDNREPDYDIGYQTINVTFGIGSTFNFKKLLITPIIEYNIDPTSNSIVFDDEQGNELEYGIDENYGFKFKLPILYKYSKYTSFGIEYTYFNNTLKFQSFEPQNDRDVKLGYNTLYTEGNYIGFKYRINF